MKGKLSALGFVLILSALIVSGCGTTTEVAVSESGVKVKAPGVDIAVDESGVKVDVPGVDVAVDESGVKVDVPGVDVAVPDVEVAVGELRTESRSVELDGAESVRVEIKMGAGKLEVAGGADELLNADFTYNVAAWEPEIDYSVSGGQGKLIVQQPKVRGVTLGSNREKLSWLMRLVLKAMGSAEGDYRDWDAMSGICVSTTTCPWI